MNAQKLVGMTQGARKRRARKVAVIRGLKPYMLYEEYRIGQRLRPCPGCPDCVTQMQDWSVDGAWVDGRAVNHRDGCSHDDPTGYCCFGEIVVVSAKCDGSGVLLAKTA